MRAYQIFAALPGDLADEILTFFRHEDRDTYRAALLTLCQQRRLRPVFIQRKPATEQMAWIRKYLQIVANDSMAETVLQTWFLKDRQDLLKVFLDGVGIEHDGKGAVENLPEALDEEKLSQAVDQLFADYPPAEVSAYLYLFNLQRSTGWEELSQLLKSDPRVHPSGQGQEVASLEKAPVEEVAQSEEPPPAKKAAKKKAVKKKAAKKKAAKKKTS
ncbi:MAG: hypothetical protein AAF555_07350 [Verrucomicrobiota bacterium]